MEFRSTRNIDAVQIYDIFEGTGQIQRRIIAKHLTGVNPT
jgi:alkylation response protein AidB-like acyl-CoA dehydrogenase